MPAHQCRWQLKRDTATQMSLIIVDVLPFEPGSCGNAGETSPADPPLRRHCFMAGWAVKRGHSTRPVRAGIVLSGGTGLPVPPKRKTKAPMQRPLGWLFIIALMAPSLPGWASPRAVQTDEHIVLAAAGDREAVEAYLQAREAYESAAQAYWQSIVDKRRIRFAKRRSGESIALSDYVLAQPPVYTGPPRPPGIALPRPEPVEPPPPIPRITDFLMAAAAQYGFVPERPKSDTEFKQIYARVAATAGLTREQAVGVYAFETGGNGAYDTQAGVIASRPKTRPISPAIGYNQLLSTNSVSLMAEHGDKFIATLNAAAGRRTGSARKTMERKLAALRQMVAFSRSVPNSWSAHDKLAKTTPGGMGIHAAVLDRDIGPLLQTQKLLDSVLFARMKGYNRPLTAAELELMNFTGDGNGFDMVTMPQAVRERVPTANFFQRRGYERNPIARRTGTVARLVAAIESKMDGASKAQGARDLAAAF
jgi:hypothetical protein